MAEELKVGDRVIELNSGDKGTITRLCADKNIVCARWDRDKSQQMVEVRNLKKE
ncbi:hypothetical protein ES704_02781 [subsurface metagenome]|jgi:hypothetical protein